MLLQEQDPATWRMLLFPTCRWGPLDSCARLIPTLPGAQPGHHGSRGMSSLHVPGVPHSQQLLQHRENELGTAGSQVAQTQCPHPALEQCWGMQHGRTLPRKYRNNFEFGEFSNESGPKHPIHLQMFVLPPICCIPAASCGARHSPTICLVWLRLTPRLLLLLRLHMAGGRARRLLPRGLSQAP